MTFAEFRLTTGTQRKIKNIRCLNSMTKKIIIALMLLQVSFLGFAENVKFITGKNSEIKKIGTELYVGYGSNVSQIKFENKNPGIKSITIEGAAFLEDLSFIKNCKKLEVLVMNNMSVKDTSFLYELPNLKVIAFDSVEIKTLPNLSKFKNLEYISLTNCGLTKYDGLTSHAKKLKFVNLAYNSISELPAPKKSDKVIYFVTGNKITTSDYSNYYFGSDYVSKLPQDFAKFVR